MICLKFINTNNLVEQMPQPLLPALSEVPPFVAFHLIIADNDWRSSSKCLKNDAVTFSQPNRLGDGWLIGVYVEYEAESKSYGRIHEKSSSPSARTLASRRCTPREVATAVRVTPAQTRELAGACRLSRLAIRSHQLLGAGLLRRERCQYRAGMRSRLRRELPRGG